MCNGCESVDGITKGRKKWYGSGDGGSGEEDMVFRSIGERLRRRCRVLVVESMMERWHEAMVAAPTGCEMVMEAFNKVKVITGINRKTEFKTYGCVVRYWASSSVVVMSG